jgi:GAF domain-containing protein
LRRLQRVFGDLKSGLASATVALNLMQLVSESYERAVIFLVKRDRLAPLGAFGFARDGSPLASAVRRLEIVPSGLLQEALASSRVRTATYQNAQLPTALETILGPPANDQIVVFPVAGSERVIAAVYADNGISSRPLRDVELLEVAAEQVGIAFENELLRRQLAR